MVNGQNQWRTGVSMAGKARAKGATLTGA